MLECIVVPVKDTETSIQDMLVADDVNVRLLLGCMLFTYA